MAIFRSSLLVVRRKFPVVFWVSIGGGAIAILSIIAERLMPLNWQGWLIFDLVLRSLGKTAYAISFLTALIIIFVLLRALVILIGRRTKTDGLQLWLPLAPLLLVMLVHLTVPVRVGYSVWREDYHRAAAKIAAGNWPVSRERTVMLPASHRRLSLTGGVSVLKEEGRVLIFFPVARSIGEYQRWLIYVSDDRQPLVKGGGDRSGIKPAVRRLEKNWYDALVY